MELLDAVSDNYCIDQTRVYASGKSNGGGLTGGVLACDPVATTRIAAFAPVSAAIYLVNNTENGKQVLPPCNPTQTRDKIPMLEFHGWLDTTIPYDGGINNRGNANSTDIIKWVHSWVKRDGFKNSANQTTSLCTDEPNKLVTRYSWQDDLVVHYNMSNFKHAWPSTTGNADGSNTTCKEADATTVILKWFTKWSLSEG
jgi:poly(3-hydroxybutyrate) depolymerase